MASASQWAWGSYCEVVSVGRLTQGDYWEVVIVKQLLRGGLVQCS